MSVLLKNYAPDSLVGRAYKFAEEAHQETKRANGEPYFTHSVSVAETVHEWGLDEESVAAALLHDVVEDTTHTIAEIEKHFGPEVAFLVNGLTKLTEVHYSEKQTEIENFRRFIISFTRDLRVVIIKLADRLHNMQTLQFLDDEKRRRVALETEEIYAPLAYRLGMQKLSGELEDLAFPYTHPDEYKWLTKTIKDSYENRLTYALKVKPILTKLLVKHSIRPLIVDARAKRRASLYKKLVRLGMDFDKIYDLVALRVVLNTVEECYAALGVVHQAWPPLPGRFKDYIARPKPNGYRSLHTTVFCIDNRITEIQMRTKEMHEEAEFGISAHWAYQQARGGKNPKKWTGVKNRRELLWVQQLQNWQKHFGNQEDFLKSLKVDFFKDRIFVITPHNDIIDLPAGATPVDFAYNIHSDIGNQCSGARVNSKIVPLDHELQSGDIVEIIIQKGKKPSEDWLRFVKTTEAREHIKSALKIRSTTKKREPLLEFKIIGLERTGYLKDISEAFASMGVNINDLTSGVGPSSTFATITAHSDLLTQQKIEKLLVKLKKAPGTKEVQYRIVR
ncbi:MAG: RelA/SpoT family protein [Candidatus Jorgensenbacteria bacterium]|nr:RelA/SpoT family protein [Candidatus Jorgensenbacteria bacterium]